MARRSGGLIVPRQTMVRYVYERPGDTFVRPVEVVPDSDDDLSADEAPASCPERKADCQKAGFKRTRVEADSNGHQLSLGFDARIFMNSSSTRQKLSDAGEQWAHRHCKFSGDGLACPAQSTPPSEEAAPAETLEQELGLSEVEEAFGVEIPDDLRGVPANTLRHILLQLCNSLAEQHIDDEEDEDQGSDEEGEELLYFPCQAELHEQMRCWLKENRSSGKTYTRSGRLIIQEY